MKIKWTNINDKLPPIGNYSENLLLLWEKCPDGIPFPQYYLGYNLGFFDGKLFIAINQKNRIDNVEFWSPVLLPPKRNKQSLFSKMKILSFFNKENSNKE